MCGQINVLKKYSDSKLVKLIVELNKVDFFEVIYDRYALFVYNKCFWFVNNEDDAKDLTQEIFIKIYMNLSKFKGASKFSTWIYAITIHTSINHVNKSKNKPTLVDLKDEFFTSSFETMDTLEEELLDDRYKRYLQVIDSLPVKQKTILLMKYQDNLSINEIVEILGVNESAVKMRLMRAKNKALDLYLNLTKVYEER